MAADVEGVCQSFTLWLNVATTDTAVRTARNNQGKGCKVGIGISHKERVGSGLFDNLSQEATEVDGLHFE